MRLSYEELEKFKQQYGVDILWSFSRFNCYRTSKYEYMLKYVQKVKENNDKMSAYAPLGTVCHDNIEAYYDGKLSADSLPNEFDDAFTVNIDIAGLCFDRCDSTKNENIKTKYYKNLMHYFENFKPILVEKNSMCEYDLDFLELSSVMKDRNSVAKMEMFSQNTPVYFVEQNQSSIDFERLEYLKNL